VPLSMCNWRDPVDDARQRHRTTSQTESPSTPEAIGDQLRSGGSSEHCHCLGARTLSFRHLQAGFNPALAWGRASRWRIVRFACAGGCCIWVRHSDFASCLDEILDHGGLLANHDLFVGHDANHDAALFH
jgi:hypothetical protein